METITNKIEDALRYWWVFFVIGAVFFIAGFVVFSYPTESYTALTAVFVFSFMLAGVLRIVYAIKARHFLRNWGWQLALGFLSLALSGFLLSVPGLAALSLALTVGFFLLFSSANVISEAIDLRAEETSGAGWLIFFGVLGMIASLFLLFHPVFGVGTLIVWTSLAFIINGIFYIGLSFRMRSGSKILSQSHA